MCDVCIHVGVWLCIYGDQKLTLGVPLTRSSSCFSPCLCVCLYSVSADVWAQVYTGACVYAHVSRGLKLRSGVFLDCSLSYLLMARSLLNSELAQMTSLVVSFLQPSPVNLLMAGITSRPPCPPGICMGPGDVNSDPRAHWFHSKPFNHEPISQALST